MRVGPYRVFFFSNEGHEPPHVHVQRETKLAKLWIEPDVRLSSSSGFVASELRLIQRIVEERRKELADAWHEFFGR